MATPLDPKHWKAIAGFSAFLPTVNSRVYYFPQGHLEEASSTPHPLPTSIIQTPHLLCTVDSVTFLVDDWNDEVFANINLSPLPPPGPNAIPNPPPINPSPTSVGNFIIPYSLTLASSHLANLEEFPIPMSCVHKILPPIGRKRKPTVVVRVLELSDPHGRVWEMKTVCNKKRNEHTLTEGWKEFVESKRLVAGDTVILMKYALSGRLLIGTRRKGKQRGNLNPETVKDAMESASKYEKFVVQLYPNAGRRSFVVEERLVESVLKTVLHPGMRIQMALEVDASRVSWFKGQLYCIRIHGVSTWHGTLWRICKVKWDKPEVMKNYKWVNPWQIVLDHSHSNAHDWEKYPDRKQVKLVDMLDLLCQRKSIADYCWEE